MSNIVNITKNQKKGGYDDLDDYLAWLVKYIPLEYRDGEKIKGAVVMIATDDDIYTVYTYGGAEQSMGSGKRLADCMKHWIPTFIKEG